MSKESKINALIVFLSPVILLGCGLSKGPSILDRNASLSYDSVVATRGVAFSSWPTSRASSYGEIPAFNAYNAVSCILPSGFTFDKSTGFIIGTSTSTFSTSTCTLKVTDSIGKVAYADVPITVKELWTDGTNQNVSFSQGTLSNTTHDSTNGYLRLITQSNDATLDSTWAPQWSNLKGYWKMDNTWTDASGNSNDGTAVGTPIFSASAKTGAASGSFDGASYVSVASSSSLNFTSEMTVMTWIYVSSSTTNFWLFSKNPIGFGSGFGIAFEHPTGKIWPHLGIGGGLRNPKSTGTTAYGQWNHVVVTYDGTNIKIYLNGSLDTTTAQTGAIGTNNGLLYIGNSPGSSTEYLFGKIDELAIWDKALTASEIELVYSRQLPQYSGSFISRVFDNLSSRSWSGIKWKSTIPFGKEIIGDADSSGSTTSSDSDSSTYYSSIVANMMSGLSGVWHFNETVSSTGGAGLDFKDGSGSALWLTANGTITYGGSGRFGYAPTFNGSSGYTSASDASFPSGSSARTVSVWIKPAALPSTNASSTIVAWGTAVNDQGYGISLHNSAGTQKINHFGYNDDFEVTSSSPLNVWTHIVVTYNGATAATYVNGVSMGTQAMASWNTVLSGNFAVGRTLSNAQYFSGAVDELAIWSRVLSSQEVIQLYRRGANRVQFQVRACADSTCSTNPTWLGPDSSASTYFTELYNNSTNTNLASPLITFPSMNFNLIGQTFLNTLSSSRYLQYRVFMESDDANTLCNYGSGATGCSPEINTVSVGDDF